MKKPLPPIQETPTELQQLLRATRDAQQQQRVQALYLLRTQQARTRLQVARLLGVNRDPVGRWLGAYTQGGIPQLLTVAKAPGKPPLLSEAMRQALRERLAQPQGFASYRALWPWLRQEYGLAIAYTTAHRFVRYPLRAKLQVPRKSHLKTP
jgi:transposase